MKVNEAPEKIYVRVKDDKALNTWNNEWIGVNDIEYVRTDSFIEDTCEWIKKNAGDYIVHYLNKTILDTTLLIESFKNYMKGK